MADIPSVAERLINEDCPEGSVGTAEDAHPDGAAFAGQLGSSSGRNAEDVASGESARSKPEFSSLPMEMRKDIARQLFPRDLWRLDATGHAVRDAVRNDEGLTKTVAGVNTANGLMQELKRDGKLDTSHPEYPHAVRLLASYFAYLEPGAVDGILRDMKNIAKTHVRAEAQRTELSSITATVVSEASRIIENLPPADRRSIGPAAFYIMNQSAPQRY